MSPRDSLILVEAPTRAVLVVVDLALAHLLRVVDRSVIALLLLGGGEAALLAPADALVRVHAFEQELGCRDRNLGLGLAVDRERRQLLEEPLNLLQLLMRGGGGELIGQLYRAAQVEPLFDLLRVGAGEVLIEDSSHRATDDLANDRLRSAHLALILKLN